MGVANLAGWVVQENNTQLIAKQINMWILVFIFEELRSKYIELFEYRTIFFVIYCIFLMKKVFRVFSSISKIIPIFAAANEKPL